MPPLPPPAPPAPARLTAAPPTPAPKPAAPAAPPRKPTDHVRLRGGGAAALKDLFLRILEDFDSWDQTAGTRRVVKAFAAALGSTADKMPVQDQFAGSVVIYMRAPADLVAKAREARPSAAASSASLGRELGAAA